MVVDSVPLREVSRTFMASLRSIGVAGTMTSVGFYLHQTNSIGSEGKRSLAVLSQQITIPLFLFTKILYCKQDGSDDACPDVTESIADVWMLLFWPLYVVGISYFIGFFVAKVAATPKHHVSTVLAACTFGNASAMPITLLNVIHSNVPSTSDFGRVDPTLFLSVFMLLYPALLWGFGGWILNNDSNFTSSQSSPVADFDGVELSCKKNVCLEGMNDCEQGIASIKTDEDQEYCESTALVDETRNFSLLKVNYEQVSIRRENEENADLQVAPLLLHHSYKASESMLGQWKAALKNCFQPPVIGSIAGFVCAAFPWLRGLFVDLDDRDNGASLQFLFDGLYAVGQAAVPINMMILGCNLSSSLSLYKTIRSPSEANVGLLSMRTMVGVVIGKMIVIPFIGILSAWILKSFFWNIPKDIDGAFYLVLMIVFLTPTANNVMVMIELSGSGAKEGMANVIALQYLVAPLILSCTMTIAIGVAIGWAS